VATAYENELGGGNTNTSGGRVSATEIIRAALSGGDNRFATSPTATSPRSEPYTAIKIFIAFPQPLFRQRRAIENQADQVVATDYA